MTTNRVLCLVAITSTLVALSLAQQHHSAAIAIPHYVKYHNQPQIQTKSVLHHHSHLAAGTIAPPAFRLSTIHNSIPVSLSKAQHPFQFRKPQPESSRQEESVEETDEDEIEKPETDRLSELLINSKFDCKNRKTGYYADEGLGCEVFHYCQDNIRHSWICPDGFTFHQVHLICMPPGNDNICEKSSKYYFVNDYLYKPINAEELIRRPNATVRYSERYFPETAGEPVKQNENQYESDDDDEDEREYVGVNKKLPINVAFNEGSKHQSVIAFGKPQVSQLLKSFKYKPQQQQQQQHHHVVFRSPEEINISLQQRKPVLFSKRSIPVANEQPQEETV